ncbi:unnamed protein product [Rotaria sp. Silwood1]|nr:unnamed protein product [Rotaria sp. Silwood1]CAF0997818.1 unnamed protein product [Rotaria sp. Silwood1]
MLNELNEWKEMFIEKIRRYVSKQIDGLEQEYDNEILYLKQQYKLFIDELYIREEVKTAEQIDQLLDRCKALKFELAALEYTERSVELLRVTQRESVNIKLDGFQIIERRNKSSTQNASVDDKYEEDSYSTATFADAQQPE